MKSPLKKLCVFVCISSVMTLLLAVVNSFTFPIIENNRNMAANEALIEVMPYGKDFQKIDLSEFALPKVVAEAFSEKSEGGYVLKLVTSGYGSDMIIMCGIDKDGAVTGAVCLSSNETLGYEKTYGENLRDKKLDDIDEVDIVSGATKTTTAYKNAVKDALGAAVILSGGSFDIRTDEQILVDNLSKALPSGKGEFEKMFLTEYLDGINEVYFAENQSGYVFVSGDEFVGISYDGVIFGNKPVNKEKYLNAFSLVKSESLEEIDISSYPDISKFTVSVKKTATGNYVIETKGAGYGIKGGNEYHPASGEYIVVRLSISPEGRIIDCLTVSEAETDGVGDACSDEKFYGQFDGKTHENYIEVDAVGGATYTTEGYLQAVGRAFEVVKTLEGGARDE